MTNEILTALITAFVTLLAVYLTNEANYKKLLLQRDLERELKLKDIHREKLEELYCLSNSWIKNHVANWSPYYQVMLGELEYNDALDLTIKHFEKNTLDYNRIDMLISLYFNSLKNEFEILTKARDSVNKIWSEHKREYKKGNIDGLEFAKPFLDEQKSFVSHSKVFLNAVSNFKNTV